MGIFYDPPSKKWQVTYEKTDYTTDNPTNLITNAPTNLRTDYPTNTQKQVLTTKTLYRSVPKTEYYQDTELRSEYDYNTKSYVNVWRPVTKTRTYYVQEPYFDYSYESVPDTATNYANHQTNQTNAALNAQNTNANKVNAATNADNSKTNATNLATNTANTNKNKAYDTTVSTASRTLGGDYTTQRQVLRSIAEAPGITNEVKNNLETNFKNFYRTEKLQTWDSNLGAKPAYGDFDPNYYKKQNPAVGQQWTSAVANDDIDITERYGENNFYLQNYTTQGKPAGLRGNAAELTKSVEQYKENPPTDLDLQAVRDLQLGVNTATQSERLLNIPEIAEEWQSAKNGNPYWTKLAKEKYLDISKPDEFAALFRLSNRPEDKQVSLNYNINAGYGVTELEDALNQAVGEKAVVDTKRFAALSQNVLKDTIAEMKKAKVQEQTLSLLKGFGGFSEIMDINKTLTNSILGDSGVGGVLSFTSAGKAEESLEKSLQKITGVQNNATYNWQQWFDTALKEKYNKDIELGYSTDQANEQIKIDGAFARDFIDKYLIPRFNTSRSMDEFVEYLDVRQSEQNPFQTQDLLNAATLTANLRAKSYLDQIKATSARSFDPNFYFNPTGDKARTSQYTDQASTVAADWEAAKKGDAYWAQQAYRFGVDINDKAAFARMHFEVKGQGKGYDAAEDILNAGKVQDQIYNNILPALKDEALRQGTVFGLFVTPEEFADEMLRGLNPTDEDSWNEVLQRYGLTSFKGTVEELKEYVAQTLRTGSAQNIREQIKYLNEKRKKPTQQVLGLTYIERPEDFKDKQASGDTELYKTFQSAGFQGTEDEFYEKFFPDLDRSEQTLLTKAGKNSALKTTGLDFTDPFASLGTIESFFADENAAEDARNADKDQDTSSGFFDLGFKDEDTEYKSKTGDKILGEFTAMFKGL